MKRLILFFLMTLIPVVVFAESITLQWEPNTETDLAGYKIHYGETSGGPYPFVADVGKPDPTRYTVTELIVGKTYYFVATAYDLDGNESDSSNEVSHTIEDLIPPNAPIGLRKILVIIDMQTGKVTVTRLE